MKAVQVEPDVSLHIKRDSHSPSEGISIALEPEKAGSGHH